MTPADPRSDEALVLAVAAGDPAAAQAFRTRHAALLEGICGSVAPDSRARAEAVRDLASADLAALFAGFDGRATCRTFVVAAVLGRFLFPRLLGRLDRDPVACAGEFGAFFRREMMRAVRAAVEGRELREDATQWIWEQLLDGDGRQLRTFAREARSPGFVAVKLRRLAQDFRNSRAAPAEGRRRTLPEALAEAPAFDQDVYRQFYWLGALTADIALLALRQKYPDATQDTVRDARARAEALLAARGVPLFGGRKPKVLDDHVIATVPSAAEPDPADEVERAAFHRAVLDAALEWPDREKLCLLMRLDGMSAGEIARRLKIPVAEVYEMMRKGVVKLRKALLHHPVAREHIATVTGNDAYLEPDRTPEAAATAGSRARKGADR